MFRPFLWIFWSIIHQWPREGHFWAEVPSVWPEYAAEWYLQAHSLHLSQKTTFPYMLRYKRLHEIECFRNFKWNCVFSNPVVSDAFSLVASEGTVWVQVRQYQNLCCLKRRRPIRVLCLDKADPTLSAPCMRFSEFLQEERRIVNYWIETEVINE